MQPRQEVFDTYRYFAAERQEIFFKRLKGESKPWTHDPILSTYKFCNTYRASDRVSQFLIKDVIYKGQYRPEDIIFRILLFKIFNKIETWNYLEDNIGDIKLASFNIERYARLLSEAMASWEVIYTSAYMSCANKVYGFDKKHENHLTLLEYMFFKDGLAQKIMHAKSLEEVYNILLWYPLIGGFMAYQLAIDLNYSEVLHFDEHSFVKAGPWAERGIKKCFESIGGKSHEYVIARMYENQEHEFKRLGIDFKSLWWRPLQYIDCQGLFCETDKYSRAAFPELKSNRKRIKAEFKPQGERIEYFYPPKWGLNERISQTSVFY